MVRSLVNVVGRQSDGMKSEKKNTHIYKSNTLWSFRGRRRVIFSSIWAKSPIIKKSTKLLTLTHSLGMMQVDFLLLFVVVFWSGYDMLSGEWFEKCQPGVQQFFCDIQYPIKYRFFLIPQNSATGFLPAVPHHLHSPYNLAYQHQ